MTLKTGFDVLADVADEIAAIRKMIADAGCDEFSAIARDVLASLEALFEEALERPEFFEGVAFPAQDQKQ